MEYLTYQRYQALGGKASESDFNDQYKVAKALVDEWTLRRLTVDSVVLEAQRKGYWEIVETCICNLVDSVPSILAGRKSKAEGTEVTSFSNGVNSFGFGGGAQDDASVSVAERTAHDEFVDAMPVELVSACVTYNYAGGY